MWPILCGIRCQSNAKNNFPSARPPAHAHLSLPLSLHVQSYCGFNDEPGCLPLNGCGSFAIYPFVLSYVFMISLVILNLFVGVVLHTYQETADTSNIIRPAHLLAYKELWSTYDPDATLLIKYTFLPEFIRKLDKPLGFGDEEVPIEEFDRRLENLKLKTFESNKIHFKDLILQLALVAMKDHARQRGKKNIVFETIKKRELFGADQHYIKAERQKRSSQLVANPKKAASNDSSSEEEEDYDDEDDEDIFDAKSAIMANWDRGGGSRKTVLR